MAEEPNQVEADQIKANIERTRDSMSATIDEIQERLNPGHLLQQAKDSVRAAAAGKVKEAVSTAKDAVNTASAAGKRAVDTASQTARRAAGQAKASGSRAASTARDNPVGAVLAATGVAWLIARGLRSRRRSAFVAGVIGCFLISQQKVSTRRATGLLGDGASADASSNADRLRRGRDLGEQVARWVGENPMAVGAAAIALGTVVGLSMTHDDVEPDTSGRSRLM